MTEQKPTVGYGDFRANLDENVEVVVDGTEEVSPGEYYQGPDTRPVSMMTPLHVDPNTGRFTKGTVGENGVGQPLENTQEGISFTAPLFGYVKPKSEPVKQQDAGLTALEVARRTIKDYDKQAEIQSEDSGEIAKEDTFPEDFLENDEK